MDTKKLFERARKLASEEPAIITMQEISVLELYQTMNPSKIAKELHITTDSVYAVFWRIRERRRRFQKGINFWNTVTKDKRFYHILTAKPELPTDEEEES